MEELAAFVEGEKVEQPETGLTDVEGATDVGEGRSEQALLLELAILTLEVALRIEALEVKWGRRGARRTRAGRRA